MRVTGYIFPSITRYDINIQRNYLRKTIMIGIVFSNSLS